MPYLMTTGRQAETCRSEWNRIKRYFLKMCYLEHVIDLITALCILYIYYSAWNSNRLCTILRSITYTRSGCTNFFVIILANSNILEKMCLKRNVYFDFLYKFYLKIISFQEEFRNMLPHVYYGPDVRCLIFCVRF